MDTSESNGRKISKSEAVRQGHPWTTGLVFYHPRPAQASATIALSFRESVDFTFSTAFHPYADQFVRRLNYWGVNGLLSPDTQSLGNPYLRAPWNPGYELSKGVTGAACLIESGAGRLPNRPGNFEAVVLEGNRLVHYTHDSGNVAGPWRPVLEITSNATGPGRIVERVSERMFEKGVVARWGTFDVVVPEADGLKHYSWQPTQFQDPRPWPF